MKRLATFQFGNDLRDPLGARLRLLRGMKAIVDREQISAIERREERFRRGHALERVEKILRDRHIR